MASNCRWNISLLSLSDCPVSAHSRSLWSTVTDSDDRISKSLRNLAQRVGWWWWWWWWCWAVPFFSILLGCIEPTNSFSPLFWTLTLFPFLCCYFGSLAYLPAGWLTDWLNAGCCGVPAIWAACLGASDWEVEIRKLGKWGLLVKRGESRHSLFESLCWQ